MEGHVSSRGRHMVRHMRWYCCDHIHTARITAGQAHLEWPVCHSAHQARH